MHRATFIALVTSLSIGLTASSASACGESLYRIGKGVVFRSYTAPLPGTILVIAASTEDQSIIEGLAAAGHDVWVVEDLSKIGDQLENRDFDVVLASFSQTDQVAALTTNMPVTYIPITAADTSERRLARKDYAYTLSNDDSVKSYLKTIHKVLKASQS